MTTKNKKKHILPPIPKRRKHLKTTYRGFPFFGFFNGSNSDTGTVDVGGGDGGGGMGESISEETIKSEVVLGSVSQEGSEDEDESLKPKEESPYKFSCAMLNLNPSVASVVDYWVKKNIPKESLYIDEDTGHDGYEDTYHVTLKYGIHDESPEKLKNLVNGFGPIPLNFGIIEKFDAPNFDVIHIKINDNNILEDVNKLITENIDNTETHSSYRPHVTLAFVKKGSCDNLIDNSFFDSLSDEVDEIYFNSKNGEESFISLQLE